MYFPHTKRVNENPFKGMVSEKGGKRMVIEQHLKLPISIGSTLHSENTRLRVQYPINIDIKKPYQTTMADKVENIKFSIIL